MRSTIVRMIIMTSRTEYMRIGKFSHYKNSQCQILIDSQPMDHSDRAAVSLISNFNSLCSTTIIRIRMASQDHNFVTQEKDISSLETRDSSPTNPLLLVAPFLVLLLLGAPSLDQIRELTTRIALQIFINQLSAKTTNLDQEQNLLHQILFILMARLFNLQDHLNNMKGKGFLLNMNIRTDPPSILLSLILLLPHP